jgi:hypothetical protein
LLDRGEACDPTGGPHCAFEWPVCNAISGQCEALSAPGEVGDACFIDASDGSMSLCAGAGCLMSGPQGPSCVRLAGHGEACAPTSSIFGHQDDCGGGLTCFGGTCRWVGEVFSCGS